MFVLFGQFSVANEKQTKQDKHVESCSNKEKMFLSDHNFELDLFHFLIFSLIILWIDWFEKKSN